MLITRVNLPETHNTKLLPYLHVGLYEEPLEVHEVAVVGVLYVNNAPRVLSAPHSLVTNLKLQINLYLVLSLTLDRQTLVTTNPRQTNITHEKS